MIRLTPLSSRIRFLIQVSFALTLLRIWPYSGIAAESDPLAEVEKRSEAWLQTRTETARLEAAWTTERALLESTLSGMKERAAAEEEKRDLARAKTEKDRIELEALQGKSGTTKQDLEQMERRLKTLDARLVALRPTLPPRLSGGLEMAFRSLANPGLSPGERMQLTVTILNRCIQFNHAITAGEELVSLPGETNPRVLEVIYWGLSQAYAVDRTAGKAWLGRPQDGTWSWEPHPEAVRQAVELIAIYQGKADPEFVSSPVAIRLGNASR